MSSELSITRPRSAITQLREIVVSPDVPSDGYIHLIITVDNTEVNVREFCAYLSLIDNTYGRLSRRGLASYSRTANAQLHTSFQPGSLEVVISELMGHFDAVTAIIILRYLLKYLPTALKDTAAAYRDYEEGAMVRERRKQLREEIKQDQELAALDKNRKNEIVAFLDGLYWNERHKLPAAQRFAAKFVRKIILKVTDTNEPPKAD